MKPRDLLANGLHSHLHVSQMLASLSPSTDDGGEGDRATRAHGHQRNDGKKWDKTLAYGGGWLLPADFARRNP